MIELFVIPSTNGEGSLIEYAYTGSGKDKRGLCGETPSEAAPADVCSLQSIFFSSRGQECVDLDEICQSRLQEGPGVHFELTCCSPPSAPDAV